MFYDINNSNDDRNGDAVDLMMFLIITMTIMLVIEMMNLTSKVSW